jgi:hypothetical protein
MKRLFRKVIKARLELAIDLKINALKRKSPSSLIDNMKQREGG